MADCRKCKHNYKPSTCEPKCNRMCDGESDFEPVTNAMRIRAMSDEELAKIIVTNPIFTWDKVEEDYEDVLNWLQSEAEWQKGEQ